MTVCVQTPWNQLLPAYLQGTRIDDQRQRSFQTAQPSPIHDAWLFVDDVSPSTACES